MDRRLDMARDGPLFLRQEAVATVVVDALVRGVQMGHYQLGAFALMANHVHVLLLPLVAPSRLLKSVKGYTAREANRVAAYIENNPVKAGFVSRAEDYRWSSAHEGWRTRAGMSAGSAS
jgi:REP element-mobilizing transposase RayT